MPTLCQPLSKWTIAVVFPASLAACAERTAPADIDAAHRAAVLSAAFELAAAPTRAEERVTPPRAPAPPSNLTSTVTSSSEVTLSWTDKAENEMGFQVERAPSGTKTFARVGTTPANVTTFADGKRKEGRSYTYRVRAYNDVGNSAYTSSLTTKVGVPEVPSHVVAAPASATQVALTWRDNATNEDGYRVERSNDGVNFTHLVTVPANTTSVGEGGIADAGYFYRVQAFNALGASAYGDVASGALTNPSAPTGLQARVTSPRQTKLSWTDNSNNESGFKIERSTDGTTFLPIAELDANATTFIDTGLASGSYGYRVRATNGVGDSADTEVVTVKIATPADSAWVGRRADPGRLRRAKQGGKRAGERSSLGRGEPSNRLDSEGRVEATQILGIAGDDDGVLLPSDQHDGRVDDVRCPCPAA
jgi:hypothetical protein